MMKKRKILSAALAAMLAASAPLAVAVNNMLSVTASAAEIQTEGDWGYKVNEDGETVTLSRYWGEDSDVVIPATLGGKSVTVIGEKAFDDESLISVTIPDSVTTIGASAFSGCRSLESVTIPEGVTTIGNYAFVICKSLSDITIPGSVTEIGYDIFGGCTSLETIAVAANSKNYSAVNGVLFNKDKTELIWYPAEKKDTSYVIPDTVTTIGRYTFSDCTSLTDVTIPHGVPLIHGDAFKHCKSLTEVTIPQSVHMIEVGCFVDSPIETVYYGGTKAQWMAITFYLPEKMVWTYVNCFGSAKIVCTDGIINGNDPDTSEPTTSEPTSSDTSTLTPGGTDPVSEPDSSANEPTVLEATLKNVDSENGLSGEALDKLLFGDSGWTWEQVEKIVFTSDKLFSVQYTAVDGSTKTLGEKSAQRAEDDGIWNTEWTLDTSLMSKDKSFVKLIAKDGTADIKATIYIKKDAEKLSTDGDQANTGIVLAIAPIALAASVVIVASKKKK